MTPAEPAFARDAATAAYYERRAGEYDEWYLGQGRFADRERPGWAEELDRLVALVRALAPARTLDVACGSGFLTRELAGPVVGLDRSLSMARLTRTRLADAGAGAGVVAGDALRLPFPAAGFDRVFTAHFYGHLPTAERAAFLAECGRVTAGPGAGGLVVVDSARRPDTGAEQWQERVLNDGSRHRVYKRYLSGAELAAEIGGAVLFDGRYFVAAGTGADRAL